MIDYVKVFTKNPVGELVCPAGKYDIGNNYYLVAVEHDKGTDFHFGALQYVRKRFDARACGTQSAEEPEIVKGKIIQIAC